MGRRRWSKGLVLFLAMGCSASVHAFSPQDTQVLTQLYQAAKSQLEELKKQTEDLKAANEEIFKAREYLNAVRDEYEFVQGFDPDREVRSLVNWGEGLTNLDDLSGANSWQQRWNLLSGEIDKRFENMPDPYQDEAEGEAKADAKELIELQVLKEQYREIAGGGTGGTSKDYQQQTASATALTASLMLEEKIQRKEAEIKRKEELLNKMEWEHGFLQMLRKEAEY